MLYVDCSPALKGNDVSAMRQRNILVKELLIALLPAIAFTAGDGVNLPQQSRRLLNRTSTDVVQMGGGFSSDDDQIRSWWFARASIRRWLERTTIGWWLERCLPSKHLGAEVKAS